jgi:nucleotide-binding universal stress UspA family protein
VPVAQARRAKADARDCRVRANETPRDCTNRTDTRAGDDIMIQHILVAVGADDNEGTLQLAIERARESHARLTAVHVVDRLPWWATSSLESDCGKALACVEERARLIAEHTLHIMQDANVEGAYMTVDLPRNMSIARVIAHAAREIDADLIVVGRSKGPKWRVWKERVSQAISRYSYRRVLIASKDGVRAETKPTPLSFTIVDSTQRTLVHIP